MVQLSRKEYQKDGDKWLSSKKLLINYFHKQQDKLIKRGWMSSRVKIKRFLTVSKRLKE